MNEVAYNRVLGEDVGRFTFTQERMKDAFVKRCEKYGAEYEVENHYIDDTWDTAIVSVKADHLRPMRYLIGTSNN